MRTFFKFQSLIFFFLVSISAPNFAREIPDEEQLAPFDQYTQALASLVFYTRESLKLYEIKEDLVDDALVFSKDDIDHLFQKVAQSIFCADYPMDQNKNAFILENAYLQHNEALLFSKGEDREKARQLLQSSFRALNFLWIEAIEADDEHFLYDHFKTFSARSKIDPNFENNRYIPSKIAHSIKPFLLPMNHPMRNVLDSIFLESRATLNKSTFLKAGFKTVATGPRSFIIVARHSQLPGYLVKAYLDTELRKKQKKGSMEWFALRCLGAEKVRSIISKYRIRHFVIADKWIYCFPAEPAPPKDKRHGHHLGILLVSDMNLAPSSRNYYAWSHYITEDHLDELYTIISRAKGSSYRPDNIAYTKNGRFAFIDTEYPSRGPDFKSIRKHLNTHMRHYWDQIVQKGGK